jgi:sterol desaturase/sphingolipid hydroxylase (fatty acid hydroxylase superfamily)
MSGISGWIYPAIVAGSFLLFLVLESAFPLRGVVENKLRRLARNLTLAGLGLATVTILQTPILLPVAMWAARHEVGLMGMAPFPRWAAVLGTILLLDYTLWFWHWLNHKVPFLWRFHKVHHVDRDLDTSTGIRFHFGELGLSVVFRAFQIVAIGADPLGVGIYQMLLFASVVFHHSNSRLPVGVERWLVRVVVTPRMHGIHHSDYRNETNSNWSSLLSVWDYLHRTVRLDVPQASIVIGVPAYRRPEEVTLGRVLALPFRERRDDWLRPDGSAPDRPPPGPDSSALAP